MTEETGTSEQPAPQWVAVPPKHPYGADDTGAPPAKTGSKAFAIAAMALGLIALLTVVVSAFYFESRFAFIGGALGALAVVCGVIAFVTKARPVASGVVGVATGGVALLAAALLIFTGAFAMTIDGLGSSGQAGDGSAADGQGEAQPWQPGDQQERLLDWPSNMATGGIVFGAPAAGADPTLPMPVPSDPPPAGQPPVVPQTDRGERNDILVYVDYSCPHCAIFEQHNGEMLRDLAATGKATVEIVPLAFLDRASAGTEYSSRAAGAVACLADSQPAGAWLGNAALLDQNVQPNGGAGMTDEQLTALLDGALTPVGGLNDAARNCINTERFVPFAQSFNQWAFANPVPGAVDTESRLQGTPTIFVNGVFFAGDTDDATAFRAFYEETAH